MNKLDDFESLWDHTVSLDPVIKNLEFTISNFNINANFKASIFIPAAYLSPQNSSIYKNVIHKTPIEYIKDLYDINSKFPIAFLIKDSCLELIIENNEIISKREIDGENLLENWVFDMNKYENTIKYQILELGQIISNDKKELSINQAINYTKDFYNNFYPHFNSDLNKKIDRYYKEDKEVIFAK